MYIFNLMYILFDMLCVSDSGCMPLGKGFSMNQGFIFRFSDQAYELMYYVDGCRVTDSTKLLGHFSFPIIHTNNDLS